MESAEEDRELLVAQVIDDQEIVEDVALQSNSEHLSATKKSQLQHLDHTHHAAIIEARSLGKSMKDIALIMHRSEHQIRRICKNHDKYGHLGRRPGSGRKRKTSAEEDDTILEEAARQRKNISGSTLHKLLGLKNISERTVRRRIKEHSAVQAPNVET
jgi:transposase